MHRRFTAARPRSRAFLVHKMTILSESTAPSGVAFKTLTASELASILGKSVASIRGDLSRCPARLPPAVRIPGGGQALWLEATVLAWLQSHETAIRPSPKQGTSTRRRGRPTKAEQLRRASAAAAGDAA